MIMNLVKVPLVALPTRLQKELKASIQAIHWKVLNLESVFSTNPKQTTFEKCSYSLT